MPKPKKKILAVPKRRAAKKSADGKDVGGRPLEYDAERHPELAKFMASRGATVAEFADAVGVNDRTIRRWFLAHPDFAEAFKFAASAFDERIERAMAERALGYEFEDEEIKVVDGVVLHEAASRRDYAKANCGRFYWGANMHVVFPS